MGNLKFEEVKNIIFDLGAVIINIDVALSIQAFASFFEVSESEVNAFFKSSSLWEAHEKGTISDAILINELNAHFDKQIDEVAFVKAWNALLLDIPTERIQLLKRLSGKYRLFLLSNTNKTHIDKINEKLKVENGIFGGLDSFFEKTYYSFEMGLRKPDPQIYNYVLNENKLVASESLFLDDNEQNILSARSIGIQSIQVNPNNTIVELLAQA